MSATSSSLVPMWSKSSLILAPWKILRDLFHRRNLLRLMVKRNLTAQYRKAYLGYGWALLEPLLFSLIYSFVFQILVGSSDRLYAMNVIIGVIGWNLFARGLIGSSNSLYSNASLFTFSRIPKSVFGAADVLTNLYLAMLAWITIIPFMLYYDLPFTSQILLIPIWTFSLAFSGWSFGMLFAAATCKVPDVSKFLNFVVRAGFFLSPVMWTYQMMSKRFGDGLFLQLAHFNPVVVPITGMRDALLSTSSEMPIWAILLGIVMPIFMFQISMMIFSSKSDKAVIGI